MFNNHFPITIYIYLLVRYVYYKYYNFYFDYLDINECEDPAIASRCVQNAECCNLPSHFLCKCKPGFIGDGEVECRGKCTASMNWNIRRL